MWQKIFIDRKNQMLVTLAVAIVFAVVGSILALRSMAATTALSLEPENGTLSSGAVAAADATASAGQYVRFPSTSTGTHPNLTPPIRAAFYYPWFPETWTVNGAHVAYHPTLGYYSSSDQAVADKHIQSLDYAGVKVSIASWWGLNTQKENIRIPLLLQRTAALGSNLKWAMYYEQEGFGDPSISQIQSELQYIKTNYASSPSYAYVNGKPVIFVYNAGGGSDDTCALADKWKQVNATAGFYVDLKVFSGYKTCANQPDSWHQYGPASATSSQPGYSYSIGPGFYRADELSARLARDPTRWRQNVTDMVASHEPWQLITTFNEWGEGTATESAQEWASPSGYGTYLDALHDTQ